MEGKKFMFFLTDAMGRSFYVENGMVGVSSSPRELIFTPGDWENMLIDNVRNQKYFALDRNFTIPLNAVEDGALILKDQYYKHWVEAVVNLVIVKQTLFYDGASFGYYYKSFYKGEIDFSNFQHTGPVVDMNVMEGGLTKIIKAKENIIYEIPMNHPESDLIYMDGVTLKEGVNYTTALVEMSGNVFGSYFTGPLIHISSDSSQNPGVLFNSPNPESMTSNVFNYLRTSTNGLAQAFETNLNPVVLKLSGKIMYRVNRNDSGAGIRLRFFKKSQTAANQNLYLLPTNPLNGAPPGGSRVGTYEAIVNFNISLAPGELLFFYVEFIGGNSSGVSISFLKETALRIDYDYRHNATAIRALKPFTVFKELIRQMSDGKYTAQSAILQLWENLRLTCGDAIRGFDTAIFKTTFSDFFKAYNVHLDLGCGVLQDIATIEHKSFFVDYTNPIQLGPVRKLSVRPAKDYMYNSIVSGQRDITYDNVNGKQEFQGRVQWITPITRITKELDWTTPYRQDSYGMEFIRINLEGKTTTDNAGDSEAFMIHTELNPVATLVDGTKLYAVDRTLNVGATGLIDPSSPFNLFLAAALMIHRAGRYIHSLFYRMDGAYIKFQSTDKNRNVTAGGVVHKGDIGIGGLGKEYFTPNEFSFEAPSPDELIEMLESNPARCMQFSYLDLTFLMLPLKSGIKAGNNEVQTFTGLADPDADLLQLINVFD